MSQYDVMQIAQDFSGSHHMRVTDDIDSFMSSPHPGRVLDAFPQATVVVRRCGEIIAHNKAWRSFVAGNTHLVENGGLGDFYANVIILAAKLDRREAEEVRGSAQAVLGGARLSAELCVSRSSERPDLNICFHLPYRLSEVVVITHEIIESVFSNTTQSLKISSNCNDSILSTSNADWVGISIIDSEARLIQWNESFSAICGVPCQILRRGLSMFEILRAQASLGEFGSFLTDKDVEMEVRNRFDALRAGKRLGHFQRYRPDGSLLKLQRIAIPGGGFVTLYSRG